MSPDHPHLHTIQLDPLPGSWVDEIINCWKDNGDVDREALGRVNQRSVVSSHVNLAPGKRGGLENPPNPFESLHLNLAPDPLRSVLASMRRRWRAAVLYERPYMDLEFWDSHAGLYERCFSDFGSACERLHFFSDENIVQGENGDGDRFAGVLCDLLLHGLTWEEVQKELERSGLAVKIRYRGYCILRPTRSFVVSRTAIDFDTRPISEAERFVQVTPEEKGGQPFLRVAQPCVAHLLNAELTVQSPEFIQQDPHLGACATASLWVATRGVGGGNSETARYRFSTITEQAFGKWRLGREGGFRYDASASDKGLFADQIKQAIASAGLQAIETIVRPRIPIELEAERLRHEIFTFIDSGFPTLICATDPYGEIGHVVAGVGFCRPDPDRIDESRPARDFLVGKEQSKTTKRHRLLASGFQVFYAHDDRYGPFNRAILALPKRQVCAIKDNARDERKKMPRPILTLGRCPPREMRLSRVIVPVPSDVRSSLANSLAGAMTKFDDFGGEVYKRAVLSWRSLLVEGAAFKCSLRRRKYGDAIRKWYARLHLPKYVWVFEFHLSEKKNASEEENASSAFKGFIERGIHGEYLYDATAPYLDERCLARRVFEECWDYREDPAVLPNGERPVTEVLPYDPRGGFLERDEYVRCL